MSGREGDLSGKTLFNRARKDGTEDREKEHIGGRKRAKLRLKAGTQTCNYD